MTLKEQIKGRLKGLYPKANLSNKRLDEITARLSVSLTEDSSEEDIDNSINGANEVYPFADIARQDDRVATFESKINTLNDKISTLGKPDPADPPKPNEGDADVPDWAKALTTTLAGLSTKMEAIENGKILDQRKEGAKKSFGSSDAFKKANDKVKEHFFSQINLDSETSVDEQITNLETVYQDMVQDKVDEGKYAGAPPNPKGGNGKATKESVSQIADDIMR